jgi:hypothetical protein
VLLHGEEGGAWPVLEYAMGLNIDTRIGFEDVLVLPDGGWPPATTTSSPRHWRSGPASGPGACRTRMRSRRAR